MPKLGYTKIESKDGKHIYECHVVTSMCTDFIEEYDRDIVKELVDKGLSNDIDELNTDVYIKERLKPLNRGPIIHAYNATSRVVTDVGKTIHTSYIATVKPKYYNVPDRLKPIHKDYYVSSDYGSDMQGYPSYNKYIDTLTDDFFEVFGTVDMKFRQDKSSLYGYGDTIKINANNIFEKDKSYIFSFNRGLGSGNVIYAYSFKNNANLHPSIDGTRNDNTYEADFVYGDPNCIKAYYPATLNDSDRTDYFYYYDGCSTYQGTYSGICLPDTYKSYRKATIRVGYELTYDDGTSEEFLSNNMSTNGIVSGTHGVKFKVSKNVVSVKLVIKLAGSFNYGKIFGRLKYLIEGGHYPGVINSTVRNKLLDPTNMVIYGYAYGSTYSRPVTDIMCDLALTNFCLSELKPFVVEEYAANAVDATAMLSVGHYESDIPMIPNKCFIDGEEKSDEMFFIDLPKYKFDVLRMNGTPAKQNYHDVYSDSYAEDYLTRSVAITGSGFFDYDDVCFAYMEFIFDKDNHTHISINNFKYKNDFVDRQTSPKQLILNLEIIEGTTSVHTLALDRYAYNGARRIVYGVGETSNDFKIYPLDIPDSYHGKKIKLIFEVWNNVYYNPSDLEAWKMPGDYIAFDTFITNTKLYVLDRKDIVPVKKLVKTFKSKNDLSQYSDYNNMNHLMVNLKAMFAIDIAKLYPENNFLSIFNIDKIQISGDELFWKDVTNTYKSYWSLYDLSEIQTDELIYKSFAKKPTYKKDYHSSEDPSKHTFDLSFEDGEYSLKRYPEVIHERTGSLADTFKSFTDFYYDTLTYKIVEGMYDKHEWFRLYGIDRESDINKIISFTRKTKESTIFINSIPIEFTKHKLLEYNDLEFIALYGDDFTLFEVGVLYSKEISITRKVDGLYVNNKGEVNRDMDGMLINSSDDYLMLESGAHFIPEGWVCSDNYVLFNSGRKIKKYAERIVYLNKIVIVPQNMKLFIPVKRCNSLFEEICYRLYSISTYSSDIETAAKALHNNIYALDSQSKEFYGNTYLYPNLDTLINDKNTLPISSDVETYLYQSKECERNFVIEESKYDLVLYKNNPFGLDMKMPKLMIPYNNPKDYKPVVFMNGKLITASPEIFKRGSTEYVILDVCDIYDKDYGEFGYSYNECIEWYRTNKVKAINEHIFEVELYTEDTKILDTVCTRFNDNFVPIPLDFLEEIKVKGDYCFEVYLDGRLLHPYYYKLNLYAKKNDLDNTVNIPAIYFAKTMTSKMSVGARVTVIQKKNIRITSYDINGQSHPIVYNTKFNKYSKFYYANGRKIPESRLIRLSPHVILLKDLLDGSYTKRFTSLKDFTGSPFILVSNEMYDVAGSITTHTKFSDDVYSTLSAYIYSIKENIRNEFNPLYLSLTSDIVGTFLSDADFDAYISMCKNSLKDAFTPPSFSNISRINPATYKVFSGAVNFNDIDITQKVSYIYSLFVKSFINARDINRFAETLVDMRLEDNSDIAGLFNKVPIRTTDDIIAKYNYFIINHLGETSRVNAASFTQEVILNNDTPFKKYTSLVFIPINYGILPKEWCSRVEPDNPNAPVLNTTYR